MGRIGKPEVPLFLVFFLSGANLKEEIGENDFKEGGVVMWWTYHMVSCIFIYIYVGISKCLYRIPKWRNIGVADRPYRNGIFKVDLYHKVNFQLLNIELVYAMVL